MTRVKTDDLITRYYEGLKYKNVLFCGKTPHFLEKCRFLKNTGITRDSVFFVPGL